MPTRYHYKGRTFGEPSLRQLDLLRELFKYPPSLQVHSLRELTTYSSSAAVMRSLKSLEEKGLVTFTATLGTTGRWRVRPTTLAHEIYGAQG